MCSPFVFKKEHLKPLLLEIFDPLFISRYNTWKTRLFLPTNLQNPFWSTLQRFQLPNKTNLPRKSTLLLSSLTDVSNTGIGERIFYFLEFQFICNVSVFILLIENFFLYCMQLCLNLTVDEMALQHSKVNLSAFIIEMMAKIVTGTKQIFNCMF